jgi:plasmid stabilization system protein ParE
MTGYDFHPETAIDLEDIWDFIANDSPAAADRVIADVLDTIECRFRCEATGAPTSPHVPYGSLTREITLLPTRRMKGRCGLSP